MMKKFSLILLFTTGVCLKIFAQSDDLRIVFIRHGEKPLKGDNLNCQGLNRALKLPSVLTAKFGVPNYVFVPALGLGESTKHSRMFQTLIPLAAKYNLSINTSRSERDSILLATDLISKTGTVIVSWEHKGIAPIVRSLGITNTKLEWPDDDFDSIWIVTFKNGKAIFKVDKENIQPSADCDL